MAMAVEAVASTAFGSRSTLTLSKPTGTADGELLVAVVGLGTNSSVVSSVPSGWTATAGSPASVSLVTNVYVYWKLASSEGASWDWGLNKSTSCAGVVLRVSFPDATPFDAEAEATVSNDDTPSWGASVTPASANSLLVMAIIAEQTAAGGTSGYAVATDNPTWAERFDETSTGITFAVATAVRSATTATGNASATLTGSGSNTTDSAVLMAVFQPLASASLTGTTALLTSPASTLIAADISSSTNVSTALLTDTSTLLDPSARVSERVWTHGTRTSTTWTHANR